MKKSLFLFLALGVGRVFSQSIISPAPFTFNAGSAQSFTVTSSDWSVEDGTGTVPSCTISGSSGTFMFSGNNAAAGSTIQRLVSPAINTNTYVNITVSWNQFKTTASSPAITAEWSNDAGATWNNISFTGPSTGNWASVGPIALPAAASGTNIVFRWYYTATGTGSGANSVGIDDIKVFGTPSPSYYYKGTGDLSDVTRWGQNTDGTGANPPDFTTASQNFFIQNCTSATLTSNWTVSGNNSFLNVGDGTSGNKCLLVIPATFSLNIGNGAGTDAKLVVTNSSSLTIQNTVFPSASDVSLGSSSTVEFNQSSAVNIWGGVTISYGNLTLSGSGAKNQDGNLVVNGNFIIASGTNYVMESNVNRNTTLSGSISCVGNITQGSSKLTIQGSSTIGTINFNGSGGIYNLTVNRSGQVMTLGSSIAVNNIAAFTNGSVTLNGKALTLSGAITFPASTSNGAFTGSSTSSLIINGSGTITNPLLMDQNTASSNAARTLNAFTLDRSGETLVLGNNLTINTSNFTNGNVSLNDKMLTLNNVINFPVSASNGVFIGSAASTFSIGGGSGNAINNSLWMSQTSATTRNLNTFNMTRATSTLVLGNSLNTGLTGGTTTFNNGVIDLNGNLWTISAQINFPTSSGAGTTKGIKGSATSSITIDDASGLTSAISNNLWMMQTSTTTRQLNRLELNRGSVGVIALTIGNRLDVYGEVVPTAGEIDANNVLWIRSDATRKGRIGTITSAGALTGNVNVETYAPGGTTGWATLGSSGVDGITVSSWDGQIPMTCLGCINSPTAAGGVYFVSIQGWDETAAASSTVAYVEQNSSSSLPSGTGYWTYLGDNFGTTGAITWTVNGTATQGTQFIPLSYSGPLFGDGYNLIANPFASPISWESVLASNNTDNPVTFPISMDDAIYVYDADLGPTAYAGGVSDTPGGITEEIPMGQGFYVHALLAGYTLKIKESDKISSTAPLLKTTNNNIGSLIRLRVDGSGYNDYAAIRFHGDATQNFDKHLDAYKIYNSPGYTGPTGAQRTNISTRTTAGNDDYAINSLPNAINQDAIIPVRVNIYAPGQHTITGVDLQNLPNSCVILKDKVINTTHDLKSSPYVVNLTSNSTEPRFELRICADAAMSVNESALSEQNVLVGQDMNGVFVKLNYDKATKSTISVTNILGQKVIDSKSVTVDKDVVYLNVPEKHQLLFVTITSDNNQVTKKIVR